MLVFFIAYGVQQLFKYVGKLLRHCLSHLGTRVFRSNHAAKLHKAVKRELVPFAVGKSLLLQIIKLLLRVVNNCCKELSVALGNGC